MTRNTTTRPTMQSKPKMKRISSSSEPLRSLLMHGAVGTALGGVCTLVGEPQNLLIATVAGWEFMEFFWLMAPITMPVLVAGLLTCLFLEQTKIFGYGTELPPKVRSVLEDFQAQENAKATPASNARLVIQALVAIVLVIGLALHLAAVGLIGLMIIVLLTAFNGIVEEHKLGMHLKKHSPSQLYWSCSLPLWQSFTNNTSSRRSSRPYWQWRAVLDPRCSSLRTVFCR